ncbi:hypothetical protein K501DRAFT_277385 [Backusella circina FSU 941]|nr:hypothetical protein K501DRAFT_277385 [Backusella circina FSU 941]
MEVDATVDNYVESTNIEEAKEATEDTAEYEVEDYGPHHPVAVVNDRSMEPVVVCVNENEISTEIRGSIIFQTLAKKKRVPQNVINGLSDTVNILLVERELIRALPVNISESLSCIDGCRMYNDSDKIGQCLSKQKKKKTKTVTEKQLFPEMQKYEASIIA